MRASVSLVVCLLLIAMGRPAAAGPILDRIRAEKVLRCGGVERPGLVEIETDGKAHGLELDMCRALASVVLGSDGRLEFTRYDSDKAFAAARAGHDDVMFLTGRELVENGLTGQVIPGPAIYVERTVVATPESSPYRHLEELAGKPICFSLGQHSEFHLHGWFAERKLDFVPMGFREDVEMNDGYKVGYCLGLAGEATTVAETIQSRDMSGKTSRLLPETLAAFPILAVSGTQDGEFAAVVAWTVETLKRADAPDTYWVRGGVESMPVEAPSLGLEKGWQKKLVDLVGSYAQMLDRNLGAQSDLKLERGLNGGVLDHGAFAPPYVE